MLRIALCIVLIGWATAIRADDLDFQRSKAGFESLKVETRVNFQVLMTAAGMRSSVATGDYDRDMHGAMTSFQSGRGDAPTGLPTKAQVEAIGDVGGRVLKDWALTRIEHPLRGRSIVVPTGFGMTRSRTEAGLAFKDARNRFSVEFDWYATGTLERAYQSLLSEMQGSGDEISYKVMRRGFFVIHGSQGIYNRYVRYHQDGQGLIGFDLKWGETEAPVYGDRLATIVSGSLWATMSGKPYPEFGSGIREQAPAPPPTPRRPPELPPMASQTQPAPRSAPQEAETKISTGTGFFVSATGHIVTNEHVVKGCSEVAVRQSDGSRFRADVLKSDRANDLALVKIDTSGRPFLKIRAAAQLGEQVAAFGYPLFSTLSSSGNFTIGNVSAMQGMKDNTSEIQVTSPIQNGNSGGPVVDGSGKLVGVVTSYYSGNEQARADGRIPQNVNFAVSSATVMGFLASHSIPFEPAQKEAALDMTEVASATKNASVLIACKH